MPPRHREAKEISPRVQYPTAAALAEAIGERRPSADASLEQFHMVPASLAQQVEELTPLLANKRVLFLGDDDHVSVLLGAFADVAAVVFEIDPRIVDSLRSWAQKLNLRNFEVIQHDIRQPLPLTDDQRCERFYVNPPYSSKTHGYGIRFWLTRALEGCIDYCEGNVVMPTDDHIAWVNDNWITLQRFVSDNGCRIKSIRSSTFQMYDRANDLGLRSENLYLQRFQPALVQKEAPRMGPDLYR